MSGHATRIRIENEIFARQEKKHSEEEQANHLMHLLMENYPLLSAATIAVDPDGRNLSVFAHRGLSGHFIKELYSRKSLPVLARALREELAISGNDARAKDPDFRMEHDYNALYAAPCRLQGETLGLFLVDSGDAELLTAETRGDLLAYARLAALFLALRNLRGKISRVPDVDLVTGLHTFKYFHEVLHREMGRARKFGQPVSLVFVKVRNLREMNEVYGHVPADNALAEVAVRIRGMLRDVDYAARSGGNIYLVMPGMAKAAAADAAKKIAGVMDASPAGQGDVLLKLAIGVAAFPKDGDTERVLIPLAESMVHESMRKGGNAVCVYPG